MASGFAQSLAGGRGGAESVSLHFPDSVSELLNSVPSAHRPPGPQRILVSLAWLLPFTPAEMGGGGQVGVFTGVLTKDVAPHKTLGRVEVNLQL